MILIRLLTAAVVLSSCLRPALAADGIFPPGVRVGLTPLVGLTVAKSFPGFETDDHSVKVLLTELPGGAYDEVKNAFTANPAGSGGVKPESIETASGLAYYTAENGQDGNAPVRRYSMIMSGGAFSGYIAVQVPEAASKIYTDIAVRQMFASAVIRKDVPVDEQLSLLPYKPTELGKFKTVRVLGPSATLVLADADDTTGIEAAPFLIVALIAASPQEAAERARFAQQAATTIPGIRDGRITMAEPIRIEGQPGFETRIDATSGKDNTPVTVVQWLRFGGGTTMRIIASAPRDQWGTAFTRFRAVRDGIQPKS